MTSAHDRSQMPIGPSLAHSDCLKPCLINPELEVARAWHPRKIARRILAAHHRTSRLGVESSGLYTSSPLCRSIGLPLLLARSERSPGGVQVGEMSRPARPSFWQVAPRTPMESHPGRSLGAEMWPELAQHWPTLGQHWQTLETLGQPLIIVDQPKIGPNMGHAWRIWVEFGQTMAKCGNRWPRLPTILLNVGHTLANFGPIRDASVCRVTHRRRSSRLGPSSTESGRFGPNSGPLWLASAAAGPL